MSDVSPTLPDLPYAQLSYRSALLSTEFAADRRARAAKAPRTARRWPTFRLPGRLPVRRHA